MNNQEIIDKFIIETSGVLRNHADFFIKGGNIGLWFPQGSLDSLHLCTTGQFKQRAKELGFVGRYRWGVVYEIDGKRPELADDVFVYARNYGDECGKCSEVMSFFWPNYYKFKIVDDRYKPADTSYLDKSDSSTRSAESSTDNGADWYDYDNQEMKTLPDNNADVELLMGGTYRCRVEYIGIKSFKVVFYRYDTHEIDHAELPTASFRPLDWDRKAKAERKRVVDAAQKECVNFSSNDLGRLYDAGFLRLPD